MSPHSPLNVSSHEPLQVRRLITVDDHSRRWPVTPIGNDWTRTCYDGPFHLFAMPEDRPAVSLVFVQSRHGNTAADNPSDLGGGPTDKHVIYEGLSRAAADGVLAGASTVGRSVFSALSTIVRKREDTTEQPILVEHPAIVPRRD